MQKRFVGRIVCDNYGEFDVQDQISDAFAVLFIESRKRFVEQHDVVGKSKRTGKRDALFLPAGQFRRFFIPFFLQIQSVEQFFRRFAVRNDRYVIDRAHVFQKPRLLKCKGKSAVFKSRNRSALWLQQPGHHAKQGRFADSRFSGQQNDALVRESKRRMFKDRAIRKSHGQVPDFNHVSTLPSLIKNREAFLSQRKIRSPGTSMQTNRHNQDTACPETSDSRFRISAMRGSPP